MTDKIMREPTALEIWRFRDACKTLAKLGRKGFYIYLAMDSMHLMVGPSHDDRGQQHQERVRASEYIPRAGGGDW